MYKTEGLTNAYEELSALVKALEDVADGLDRVDTSAEWWSRVNVRVSEGPTNARAAVRSLRSEVKRAVDEVVDIQSGIVKTRSLFEEADRKIIYLADSVSQGREHEWSLAGDASAGGGGAWGGGSGGGGFRGSGGGGGSGWGDDPEGGLADGAFAVFSGAFGGWLGYEADDGHPGITTWLGKAGANVNTGVGNTEANVYFGKVEAEAKLDGHFVEDKTSRKYKDGKWKDPKNSFDVFGVEAALGGSVALFSADYKSTTGNDLLGTESKLEGSVGNAKAKVKGKLSVGDDGINAYAKGEAMVSAVEGKAKGTFNFLGFEISAEATGYAGAAGIEGEFGIKDGKFTMKGGVAAVLGGSVGIEIGLNDTGEKIVNSIAEGFQDFTEGVGNVAESIGDWFASVF